MIILRMKIYIEMVITGNGTPGADVFFTREHNQYVSKEPTWTLTMDPNVTHIFIIIDEDGGRASKIKIL
jgi:hypothetical protein